MVAFPLRYSFEETFPTETCPFGFRRPKDGKRGANGGNVSNSLDISTVTRTCSEGGCGAPSIRSEPPTSHHHASKDFLLQGPGLVAPLRQNPRRTVRRPKTDFTEVLTTHEHTLTPPHTTQWYAYDPTHTYSDIGREPRNVFTHRQIAHERIYTTHLLAHTLTCTHDPRLDTSSILSHTPTHPLILTELRVEFPLDTLTHVLQVPLRTQRHTRPNLYKIHT